MLSIIFLIPKWCLFFVISFCSHPIPSSITTILQDWFLQGSGCSRYCAKEPRCFIICFFFSSSWGWTLSISTSVLIALIVCTTESWRSWEIFVRSLFWIVKMSCLSFFVYLFPLSSIFFYRSRFFIFKVRGCPKRMDSPNYFKRQKKSSVLKF